MPRGSGLDDGRTLHFPQSRTNRVCAQLPVRSACIGLACDWRTLMGDRGRTGVLPPSGAWDGSDGLDSSAVGLRGTACCQRLPRDGLNSSLDDRDTVGASPSLRDHTHRKSWPPLDTCRRDHYRWSRNDSLRPVSESNRCFPNRPFNRVKGSVAGSAEKALPARRFSIVCPEEEKGPVEAGEAEERPSPTRTGSRRA